MLQHLYWFSFVIHMLERRKRLGTSILEKNILVLNRKQVSGCVAWIVLLYIACLYGLKKIDIAHASSSGRNTNYKYTLYTIKYTSFAAESNGKTRATDYAHCVMNILWSL